jgi:histone H3/H4
MTELPTATIKRLIKKGGAERVGDDAAEALAVILEEIALQMSAKAVKLASHAGRKTVNADDIRLSR